MPYDGLNDTQIGLLLKIAQASLSRTPVRCTYLRGQEDKVWGLQEDFSQLVNRKLITVSPDSLSVFFAELTPEGKLLLLRDNEVAIIAPAGEHAPAKRRTAYGEPPVPPTELRKPPPLSPPVYKDPPAPPTEPTNKTELEPLVFIAHGRDPQWHELALFLRDRLGLRYTEFNSESAAGISTQERLHEMLQSAAFALLMMTAEDEQLDGTYRARENVIHEAGLFQGKLGFRKAVILLEEGCHTFSNIHGLTHISFTRGRIRGSFEDIRSVLEREGILAASHLRPKS